MEKHYLRSLKLGLGTILLLAFGGISVGCEKIVAYHQFADIPDKGWDKEHVTTFHIDTVSIHQDSPYRISLELVHNATLPYKHLWLVVQYKVGASTIRDTVGIDITDKDNRRLGAGFGSYYQLGKKYKEQFYFEDSSSYTISITHAMPQKVLHGVEKIGLKVE